MADIEDLSGLDLSVESPFSREAAALMEALDQELNARYPGHSIHGCDLRDVSGEKGIFVLARQGGSAVGCGAVRALEAGIGEVKRMFVQPQLRRHGVARQILWQLEAAARERGFTTLRLETGTRQPEALALYESCGYKRIRCFGEYTTDPHSACFEKQL